MSSPYIGEIRMFAGNFAPTGWMFCQGQTLAIAEYDALFALIGTTYGGDGVSTFALPDLQSRMPMHAAASYPLGGTGGAETVALTTAQVPAHTHVLNAASGSGTSLSPGGAAWASWGDQQYSSAQTGVQMAAGALQPAGGGQPHDNLPPYLALNFIISLFGVFPSQT